jgi:hypothetical protein
MADMKTIIGWAAEEAFAQRMLDAARAQGNPVVANLESDMEAGEWGLLVSTAFRSDVPVSRADIELARKAWPPSVSKHIYDWIERSIPAAVIVG